MWNNKWIRRGAYLFVVLMLISFSKTLIQTYQASKRVDNLKQEVEVLESEKKRLEEEQTYRESDEYVEKVARNKLNLAKPGDTVVVIQEDKQQQSRGVVKGDAKENLSIPEQWQQLILKG